EGGKKKWGVVRVGPAEGPSAALSSPRRPRGAPLMGGPAHKLPPSPCTRKTALDCARRHLAPRRLPARAFGCSAYRQSGTAEIDRRRPKMQPTFFGRARGRPNCVRAHTEQDDVIMLMELQVSAGTAATRFGA